MSFANTHTHTAALLRCCRRWLAATTPTDSLGAVVCVSRWCARAVLPALSANFAKILDLLRRRRKIIIADLITRALALHIDMRFAGCLDHQQQPPDIPFFYTTRLLRNHISSRIQAAVPNGRAHVNLVIAGVKTLHRNLAVRIGAYANLRCLPCFQPLLMKIDIKGMGGI